MQTTSIDHSSEEKVIPFRPEGDFYFSKGVQAFKKRHFTKAVKWLKRAVELVPEEPLYQCQLSVIYTETGEYHQANEVLTNVLAKFGHDYVDCYYLIANNYAHLGLFQDAMKYARDYIQKAPNGDFKEEAEQLLTVLDIEEDEEEDWAFEEEDELMAYQESAFYYQERLEWDKAMPLLEDMIRLFPSYTLAKHDYAHALFQQGSESEAIALEEQSLEQEPNSLLSVCNLALFYHKREENEKATPHIHTLLNVYPIHEQQKLRVATTLAQVGQYKEAHERFNNVSKSKLKGHVAYYKWYSITLYHMGDPSGALSLWEEGCRKHPHLSEQGGPWNY
ncbi:hypothetical protein N781_13555 [Pontibacillus halophilus JSM 076056 = DSM 19796]|uniref:Uncharacterized protein n=1 Tax=Pontibacillus halophilus JSM 076056 = DSM 19796 TaxID=1385510 RepID=A0A0A5GNU3_9BACI|nr:tetratricopeptide repeat protein [Pontibacillus halophilus]KGX92908.1 hypothetical protein N781_13555 [Pontibacillus halophilus JSM 076056 = DSM 19796]